MRTWIVIIALICCAAGPVFADVSNEVIVGLEGDSSKEVKDSFGGISIDVTDTYKTENSLFVLQYTKFFAPLKDDDTPIELRRFLQHPSTLSAGIIAIGETEDDTRNPLSREEGETNASLLTFGGEYFFPTDTGLFLNLSFGSGKFKRKVNGVSQIDADVDATLYDFGVRHYVAPGAEVHLTFAGDSMKAKASGGKMTSKQNMTLLGIRGVISNVVGLSFDLGGGKRTDTSTGSADDKFDVGQMTIGITGYIGKQFSLGLELDVEAAEQTGLPSGVEYTESTGRFTLTPAYWFSERFGMQLPIYSETYEEKLVTPLGEAKFTVKNTGMGLYAAFRF